MGDDGCLLLEVLVTTDMICMVVGIYDEADRFVADILQGRLNPVGGRTPQGSLRLWLPGDYRLGGHYAG